MSHLRRCLPVLVVLLALAPEAGAATKTTCTSKLSATQVTVGQSARLTGRVKPHTARAVRLQLKQGKRWSTAARKHAARTGRFGFTLPTGSVASLTLRVYVPKTKSAKAAACSAVKLAVTAKGGGGGGGDGTGTGGGDGTGTGGGQVQAAPAFLAVYALASDQTADPDHVAAMRWTIDQVDGWYGTQTTGGVVPRWTRGDDGKVDVVTLKLDHSVAD